MEFVKVVVENWKIKDFGSVKNVGRPLVTSGNSNISNGTGIRNLVHNLLGGE